MKTTKILIAVILSTLFCSSLFGQRSNKNAMYKVWVRTVENEKVHGYLGAVGESTIVVLNLTRHKKRTLSLEEIKTIKFRRKGKVTKGIVYGAFSGLALGGGVGFASGDDPPPAYFSLSAGQKATILGVLAVIPGAIIGGGLSSNKTKILIDGDLERLRTDLIPYVVSDIHPGNQASN